MEIPPTIAAEIALNRQNMAMAMVKQAASGERAIATILDQALSVAPTGRGTRLNLSA